MCSYPGLWKFNEGVVTGRTHPSWSRLGGLEDRAEGARLENKRDKAETTDLPMTMRTTDRPCASASSQEISILLRVIDSTEYWCTSAW